MMRWWWKMMTTCGWPMCASLLLYRDPKLVSLLTFWDSRSIQQLFNHDGNCAKSGKSWAFAFRPVTKAMMMMIMMNLVPSSSMYRLLNCVSYGSRQECYWVRVWIWPWLSLVHWWYGRWGSDINHHHAPPTTIAIMMWCSRTNHIYFVCVHDTGFDVHNKIWESCSRRLEVSKLAPSLHNPSSILCSPGMLTSCYHPSYMHTHTHTYQWVNGTCLSAWWHLVPQQSR